MEHLCDIEFAQVHGVAAAVLYWYMQLCLVAGSMKRLDRLNLAQCGIYSYVWWDQRHIRHCHQLIWDVFLLDK